MDARENAASGNELGAIYVAAFRAVNNGEYRLGTANSARIAPAPATFPHPDKPLFVTGRIGVLAMGNPFLWLISELIWIYIYILIASAILSWLIAFNVVNTRNDIVRSISYFLYAVTEPVLRPIRRVLPDLGGIDISPVILMIGLIFLDKLIIWLYFQLFV